MARGDSRPKGSSIFSAGSPLVSVKASDAAARPVAETASMSMTAQKIRASKGMRCFAEPRCVR